MKQMKRSFLLLLCAIFCLYTLTGCQFEFMNDKENNASESEEPNEDKGDDPSGPIDPDAPDLPDSGRPDDTETPSDPKDPEEDPDEPEGPSVPDEPKDPDPSDPSGPTQPEDPAEKEKYAYSPQIFFEIPRISINTSDGSSDFITRPNRADKLAGRIDYVSAEIDVSGPEEGMQLTAAPAKVKARGNYTLEYDKKSIRIKFDKKQNLLGLNEGKAFKSWALLADYKDLSGLNNATAFYLGKTILGSDGYYCSDFCTVEVYVNDQYWGVYLLAEQQEAKEGRANAVEADHLETGTDVGYLMEFDGYYSDEAAIPNGQGDPVFTVNYGGSVKKLNGSSYTPWQNGFTVKSDLQSDDQHSFLQSYVENVFRVLRAAAYENHALRLSADGTRLENAACTPQEAVEAVVDLPSLVDTYILQEITCDPDIAWSSFYISLDMRQGGKHKLVFEAPWDYDSAFGIKWGFTNANGMYAANCENPWLTVLIHTDFFQKLIREKWEKLQKYNIFKNALKLVEQQSAAYMPAFIENLERWPSRLWGNDELSYEMNQLKTQQDAADHLYKWLRMRINYLDTVFGKGLDVLVETPVIMEIPEIPTAAKHRFEAENCEHDPTMLWDDYFGGASGGAFLKNVQQETGSARLVTLTVNVSEKTDVFLCVGLSKRSFAADFFDWFALFVNDEKVYFPPRTVEACKQGEPEWGTWTNINIGYLHLEKGENTIRINMVSNVATNLDYFDLYCDAEIDMIQNW